MILLLFQLSQHKPLTETHADSTISQWFGQPGLGTQFYSGPRTIADLIGNKTLERVDPSVLISNRQQQGCGY